MANAQQISAYYSLFGFRFDNKSVATLKNKVKEIKDHISKQLSINVKITKFTIGKRELNAAIKAAAAEAGGVKLSINSFSVNATELRKAVQNAFDKGVTLRVNATARTSNSPRTTASSTGSTNRSSFGTSGGVLNRYGMSGLAGYATGVGVMNVNQISEDIQTSKVSLNTITGGRGVDAFQWMKNQGNELGFDYRSQLPIFSNYLGASVNKQGYDKSLESYKNLTQYGLTHGSDRVSLERAMLSIGQMWSKGKIMAEELNQQLAEAKGFSGVKAIIADAYQESTGGKLTGQKAEAALIEAMKKGLVETAKVMPLVTERMGIAAAGGKEAYLRTTGAQHNRFRNSMTNAVEVFGAGGFDEGMMRFFKFMADFLDEHSDDIRELGNSFLKLEKAFEKVFNVGERVISFFHTLNPELTNMATILLPLSLIMNKFSMALTGIGLVMDDIDTYMTGGDSMLGRFISYMKDLTGMDFTSVAAGFGVLGLAITAAFSPLITVIGSITALIEAHKYVQSLNKDNSAQVGRGGLPSSKDLREGMFTKAKNKLQGTFLGNTFLPVAAGASAALPWLFNYVAKDKGDKVDWRIPEGAVKAGSFSAEELERLQVAVGTQQMTPSQAMSYFNSRISTPAGSIGNSDKPMIFNINGEFNNVTMTLEDLIKNAGAQFTGGTQPAKPSGG